MARKGSEMSAHLYWQPMKLRRWRLLDSVAGEVSEARVIEALGNAGLLGDIVPEQAHDLALIARVIGFDASEIIEVLNDGIAVHVEASS